jgi:hemerythrin-like metal-binding protein
MSEDWDLASLGDGRLDHQHRNIARRLRSLDAAVVGGQPDEIRSALRILSLSVAEHWQDEERWLEESGYPGLSEHRRHHDALVVWLASVADPRTRVAAPEAAREVAEAIEQHLRVDDLKPARFFAARANFKAMAEARPGRGPALTPIPGALTPVPAGEKKPKG